MSIFDPQTFANPSADYRPLQIVHGMDRFLTQPDALTGEEGIDQRFELLKRLGIGGIVTNVGFADYMLSPRQWEIFRYGLGKAADLGMVLWVYDEKGYPSGGAGGIVTRAHPEYTAIGLACYRQEIDGPAELNVQLPLSCRRFIAAYATPDADSATRAGTWNLSPLVDAQGTLRWSAPAGHWTLLYLAERVMFDGTHCTGNYSEFRQYINLLNPAAVREFLRVTHEQYVRETPPDLWNKVRAIFTDEPSLMTPYVPAVPEKYYSRLPTLDAPLFKDRPPAVPWIEDFPAKFQALKGYDLTPHLFELFASHSAEASYIRQDYYDVVTRLYTQAFYTQVLQWCQAHGVYSSGHILAEENIVSHVAYHGSLFAPIREMDLPGIDMLDSDPQNMLAGDGFMTIKQVSSAAHLAGRKLLHSESSDFMQGMHDGFAPLPQRRGQGNLQYVLGINQITAYWGWDKIGDDAYRQYNDYMGRLASLLTGGSHACDVAVFYPIRSAWVHYFPQDVPISWRPKEGEPPSELAQIATSYPDIVRDLLRKQIDLDIVDEEAITTGKIERGALSVADERYRAIVLPQLTAISIAAARALAEFVRSGGLLISAGALPTLAESPEATAALQREFLPLFSASGPAYQVTQDQLATCILANLQPDLALGQPNAEVLYTHRCLEGRDVYFIANNAPQAMTIQPRLRVPGPYTVYRPIDGSVQPAGSPLELKLAEYEGVFVVTQ
jgi:hypothetical protein